MFLELSLMVLPSFYHGVSAHFQFYVEIKNSWKRRYHFPQYHYLGISIPETLSTLPFFLQSLPQGSTTFFQIGDGFWVRKNACAINTHAQTSELDHPTKTKEIAHHKETQDQTENDGPRKLLPFVWVHHKPYRDINITNLNYFFKTTANWSDISEWITRWTILGAGIQTAGYQFHHRSLQLPSVGYQLYYIIMAEQHMSLFI